MDTASAVISARLEKASAAIAFTAFLSGFAVLISWIWKLPGLSRIHPLLGGMGAHAALGFILAGAGLLLVRRPPVRPARRITASVCAATLIVMTVASLGRSMDLSLGGLLPGRLPSASAEVFLALGLALLTIDVSIGRWRPAELFSFVAALIALFALVAYTLSSVSIFTTVNPRPLAFHSVLLMVLFSFALLAARPRAGLMSFATSNTVAGLLVRRMLPAVVGIPAVIGWLATEAQRAGAVPPFLTVPYYAVAIIIVFATMTWLIAGSLYRIDLQRREAQEQVQQLNAELEQRVADRTAQLERVNGELESFSYSVSHDLRAPLRHIDGFAQLLTTQQSGRLDDNGKRHLAIIREGAQNMGRMIDDLLSLARLDRQQLARERTDLNAIVQKVRQEVQRDVGSRMMAWTCEDRE